MKKVEGKSDAKELSEQQLQCEQKPQTFMSYQVKDHMKLAPITRRNMNRDELTSFDQLFSTSNLSNGLYLSGLQDKSFIPRKTLRTWPDDEDEKSSNDDLYVIGNSSFDLFSY